MWLAMHLGLFQIYWSMFVPELAKLDDIWLRYNKYKKGDIVFWDTV